MSAQGDKLAHVRSEVRSILEGTPAFRAMSAPDQKALANAMVRVSSYLADDPQARHQSATGQENLPERQA